MLDFYCYYVCNKGMENIKDCLILLSNLLGNLFKQLFSLYQYYSNLRTQMIAAAIGVEPIFVSVTSYIFTAICFTIFMIRRINKR